MRIEKVVGKVCRMDVDFDLACLRSCAKSSVSLDILKCFEKKLKRKFRMRNVVIRPVIYPNYFS